MKISICMHMNVYVHLCINIFICIAPDDRINPSDAS